MLVKTLKDDFHNTAKIEKHIGPAYYGGAPETGYKLIVSADYDNDNVYFVSVYCSVGDALAALSAFSCGTFRAI